MDNEQEKKIDPAIGGGEAPDLTVPLAVSDTKRLRKGLDEQLQYLKACFTHRRSAERTLSMRKIQEAIMWLGMDLKAQKEEGVSDTPNPYPGSYNPDSADIEPTADGLKL